MGQWGPSSNPTCHWEIEEASEAGLLDLVQMKPFFNSESSNNEIIEEHEMGEFENMWINSDPSDVETLEEDLSDMEMIETIDEQQDMSESENYDPFEAAWDAADEPSESEPIDVETLEEDLSDIDIENNDEQNEDSESETIDPFEAAELLSESDSLDEGDEGALEVDSIFYKEEMIEISSDQDNENEVLLESTAGSE